MMPALKILLIEDNPVDCELIEATLKSAGIIGNWIMVDQRQALTDAIATERLDLILSDYILPSFNGLDALELAQSACPEVPFILVSGVLGEENAIDALQQGATDYVLKQRLRRLVPAVKRALQESKERQERQKAVSELRKTDDLLRAIADASPVGIFTIDLAHRITTWNTMAEQIYGWSKQEITGQVIPMIPDLQQPGFGRYVEQVLKGQQVLNQECQHVTRTGHHVDVSLSLAPLHNDDDQIYGIVITSVDITERKQNELKLAQQAHALVSANQLLLQAKQNLEHRNQDLKQFAYALSHDLKAPLRGINNLSTWIMEDFARQLPPEGKRQMNLLHQRVERMESLINGLIEVIRVGQNNTSPELIDLNELLIDIISLLALPKEFTVHIQPNLPKLWARPLSLRQILSNLIGNAVKHNYRANGFVSISATCKGSFCEFSITDNGPGIAPEHHERVFEIFQTLKSANHGKSTGIGLAMVKRIVKSEGGEVWVDSQPGHGSTFRFTWPL